MESLHCICIEVEFRTGAETSTIHGEFTETYLRKIADELERELRKEHSSPHNVLR
jgi:hypothetical protein